MILYSIRSETLSQWRNFRIGVMCLNFGAWTTVRARAFWMCCFCRNGNHSTKTAENSQIHGRNRVQKCWERCILSLFGSVFRGKVIWHFYSDLAVYYGTFGSEHQKLVGNRAPDADVGVPMTVVERSSAVLSSHYRWASRAPGSLRARSCHLDSHNCRLLAHRKRMPTSRRTTIFSWLQRTSTVSSL